MEAYLDNLCDKLDDVSVSENPDDSERHLSTLRARFSEFSDEEKDLLNTAIKNKYELCNKYLAMFQAEEVRNLQVSNQIKCEIIGSALSDLKYEPRKTI